MVNPWSGSLGLDTQLSESLLKAKPKSRSDTFKIPPNKSSRKYWRVFSPSWSRFWFWFFFFAFYVCDKLYFNNSPQMPDVYLHCPSSKQVPLFHQCQSKWLMLCKKKRGGGGQGGARFERKDIDNEEGCIISAAHSGWRFKSWLFGIFE